MIGNKLMAFMHGIAGIWRGFAAKAFYPRVAAYFGPKGSRSKYQPHEWKREVARRLRQIEAGTLKVSV